MQLSRRRCGSLNVLLEQVSHQPPVMLLHAIGDLTLVTPVTLLHAIGDLTLAMPVASSASASSMT